jgi:cysteine desulfurase
VELTGHPRKRLPGHLSVVARETDGESIVMNLDLAGIAASTGAACTTGSTEPSHVLTALGYPEDEARGSLRLTLGRTTTDEEIDRAVEILPRTIAEARVSAAALAADPLGERVGA